MGFSKAKATGSNTRPARARRRWRAGVVVTLGALALSSGFALSAQAATSNVSHHNPPSGVTLPKSSLKRVGSVACGKVGGRWIPGTVISGGYFLSDAQQARNHAARARHETGRARKTDLASWKLYTQRAKQRQSICARAGSTRPIPGGPPSTGAPATTSPPSSPAPGGTTPPSGGSSTPTPPPGEGSSNPTPATSKTAAISVPSGIVGPGTTLAVTGSGFAPGSTVQLELHSTPTSLGSVVVGSDGTFSTDVTIPPTTEGGEHHVLGNGIGADGGVAAPEAAVAVDAAPPQLQSFSITPQTVDTSSGSQTITVEAHITDDLSGVAEDGYTHGVPSVFFTSPSGQTAWASFQPSSRIPGTSPQDGVYRTTITLPQYSDQGTWTVSSFSLVDMAGNQTSLTAPDMHAAGMPTTFKQTSAGDTTAPQLQSFSITPQTVDTSSGSQTITVEAHITDDLSGVAEDGYTHGVPSVFFTSPSGQTAWASFQPSSRIPGTSPQDGVYRTTITLPQYSDQGTWTVSSFSLVDMAGNQTSLTAPDMHAAGMPTTFNNGQG